MLNEPLLTLKQAAAALGMDRKSVQEKLIAGQLKGEKRSVWWQERWFIYKNEVDALVAKQKSQQTDDDLDPKSKLKEILEEPLTFDIESVSEDEHNLPETRIRGEVDDGEIRIWLGSEREKLKIIVEQLMQPLVDKVTAQALALAEKDAIIETQAMQLKLLPDLKRQSEEERRQRQAEITTLVDRIATLEKKKHEGELAKEKIVELEEAIEKLKELSAEEKIVAEEQMASLCQERNTQVAALEGQLATLSNELKMARQPWWKHWFMPVRIDDQGRII